MACNSCDCDYDVLHFAATVYEKDIKEQLVTCVEEFMHHMPTVISMDFRKQLEEDGDHLRNKKETLDVCWAKFVECEDDAKYKELMDFANGSAHTKHPRLLEILNLNPPTEQKRKDEDRWKDIVNRHLKDLEEITFKSTSILSNLRKLLTISEITKQKIQCISKNNGDIHALYELVDQLPYRHDRWYYHFLLVLLYEDFDVVFKLEPCLQNEKETLTNLDVNDDYVELISGIVEASKTRESESQAQPADKADDKALDKKGEVEIEPHGVCGSRMETAMDFYRDSPEGAESDDGDAYEQPPEIDVNEELTLRDYQKQLAEPGVQGKNNIVFAPTGSGKTIVAVHIAMEHMRSPTSKRKIAFLVPAKPLAAQQAAMFSKYLGKKFNVRDLIGGEGTTMLPLSKIIEEYDVIVMTAQLLVNALKTDYYKLESICAFSLVIFDECHHCDKGHPYNDIMISYFKDREAGRTDLPQILGLTASFGANKADKLEKVQNHVLSSCARLDAIAPPKVVEIDEKYLMGWRRSTQDEVIVCDPKSPDYAGDRLENLMKVIETKVTEIYRRVNGESDGLPIPKDRGSTKYTTFVNGSLKKFRISSTLDDEDGKVINMAVNYLDVCNRGLILSHLFRSQDAKGYIMNELGNLSPQTDFEAEVKKKLEENFKDEFPNEKNPALEKMKEVITKQFEAKRDSRALIFVKEREYVTAILEWFHEELPDYAVDFVVGAQAAAEKGGEEIFLEKGNWEMEEFRSMTINISL